MLNKFRLSIVWAMLTMVPGLVHAGRSCEQHAPDARVVQQAMGLAYEAQQKLNTSGAEVALIARADVALYKAKDAGRNCFVMAA